MKPLSLFERALWGILSLVICGVIVLWVWKTYKKTETNEANGVSLRIPLSDFSLMNHYGEKVTRNDLLGKIVVADFIFTSCAGACPIMTTKMIELSTMFKYEREIRFVSFSVDPETDSPEVLKQYAKNFGIRDSVQWIFLTGEKKEITSLVKNDFKLALLDSGGTEEETIIHSQHFVLLNERAEIVGYFDSEDEQKMRELYFKIRNILQQNKQ
ncbi:MAG: SCO family protein [Ignavibacteria bacterium]|nr:SCO family protein [Ignavibacteria bacterium]